MAAEPFDEETLAIYQKMFNLSREELNEIIGVLAKSEQEAVGSMGDDTPMPVLSKKGPFTLRLFPPAICSGDKSTDRLATGTNVMSLQTNIGRETSLFDIGPEHASHVIMNSPILSQRKLRQLIGSDMFADSHAFIDLNLPKNMPLPDALDRICELADQAVDEGKLILMLSDRYLKKDLLPVHALLATGAVHQHLVRRGTRCAVNIVVETGVARDAHQVACLIGYGATAVYPYLAYQCLHDLAQRGRADRQQQLGRSYRRGIRKGPVQDHVQDGHLVDLELSRRAVVRDRRPRTTRSSSAVSMGRSAVSRERGLQTTCTQDQSGTGSRGVESARRRWSRAVLLKYVHGGEYHCFNPDVVATLAGGSSLRRLRAATSNTPHWSTIGRSPLCAT